MSESTYDIHPSEPQWTHIALRVGDVSATIDWYLEFTPLVLLDRREDDGGYGAWLGMPDTGDHPFVLVVAQFFDETDPYGGTPRAVLAPFAHIGIEMPHREDVDAMAEKGEAAGCLEMVPTIMPPPIGYLTMLSDPDGNLVEFSWDQGVYTAARSAQGRVGHERRPVQEA